MKRTQKSYRIALGGAAVLAAIGLVACSSDGGEPSAASGTSEAGAQIQGVTAGVIPVTDAGPIAMGLDAGIWEDNGLDLTIETARSVPDITSAVMAGDYQIGYNGATGVFQAIENGIDLVVIAAASATGDDPDAGINDILMRADAEFASAADLEGRKVAVSSLGGYTHVLGQIAVAAEGGNPDAVDWVELAVPDQPAALAGGMIDAYVAGEPFGTLGRDQGFVTLSNPHLYLSDGKGVVGGVWYASREAVEADPELYAQIVAAIDESNALALSDDAGLRAAIAEFTGIAPDLAAKIRLGSYGKLPLSVANLQPLADASLEYGVVQNEVDLDALIWQP